MLRLSAGALAADLSVPQLMLLTLHSAASSPGDGLAGLAHCPALRRLQLTRAQWAGAGVMLLATAAKARVALPQVHHLRVALLASAAQLGAMLRPPAALPRVFSGLRVLEVDASFFGRIKRDTGLSDILLVPLRGLPHLEALSILRAPFFKRLGIENLVGGLPGLQRFTISCASPQSGSEVTAEWLASFERLLRPRLVRCVLLPHGTGWEAW